VQAGAAAPCCPHAAHDATCQAACTAALQWHSRSRIIRAMHPGGCAPSWPLLHAPPGLERGRGRPRARCFTHCAAACCEARGPGEGSPPCVCDPKPQFGCPGRPGMPLEA
jgi:hypothetical protein